MPSVKELETLLGKVKQGGGVSDFSGGRRTKVKNGVTKGKLQKTTPGHPLAGILHHASRKSYYGGEDLEGGIGPLALALAPLIVGPVVAGITKKLFGSGEYEGVPISTGSGVDFSGGDDFSGGVSDHAGLGGGGKKRKGKYKPAVMPEEYGQMMPKVNLSLDMPELGRGGKKRKTNPWLVHTAKVRKENPGVPYKEILKMAAKTY
jgi:hypothetical protein